MSIVDRVKDLLAAFDLLAARLRGPLKTLAGLGIAFQGAVALGTFKLPPGTRWTNAVAAISITLAYFTMRGKQEVTAMAAASLPTTERKTPTKPGSTVG